MDEFDLIAAIAKRAAVIPSPGVSLGIGDDAAILQLKPGHELITSVDTLVEGRHFLASDPPASIGHRALAVNLSDLAAMGAEPVGFLLSLTLPQSDQVFVAGITEGLLALAAASCCPLVGGDTTQGPLAIAVTVLGQLPAGTALRRSGAKPGDDIYVSGALGDAAAALALGDAALQALRDRLWLPTPRLDLGQRLRGIATAAIDLSDGLAGDLRHLLTASSVGAMLDLSRLPTSKALAQAVSDPDHRLALQLTGGDDYELCFTAPPTASTSLNQLARETGIPITPIGTITAEPTVIAHDAQGRPIDIPPHGYRHFPGNKWT